MPWAPMFPPSPMDPEEEARRQQEEKELEEYNETYLAPPSNPPQPQAPLEQPRPTPPRQPWQNPVKYPEGPDYSRVDAIQKQMDSLDRGIAPFLPFQGFQEQQNFKRKMLADLMQNELRRAEANYTANLNNYTRMEKERPERKVVGQPFVDEQGNYRVLQAYGDEPLEAVNLGRGKAVSTVNAETAAASREKIAAQREADAIAARKERARQFDISQSNLMKRAMMIQNGADRRALVNLTEGFKYEQKDLDLEQRELEIDKRQAERNGDLQTVSRLEHQLSVNSRKQEDLMRRVKEAEEKSRVLLQSGGGQAQAPASQKKVAPEGTVVDTPQGRMVKRGGKWVPFGG